MRITKVYTRTGDGGDTGLGGGQRVPKDSLRVVAYGVVDELGAHLGCVLAGDVSDGMRRELTAIQNDLFDLGSDLCILEEDKEKWPVPRVEPSHVEFLERAIDGLQERLEPLREFILPGGTETASRLHVARTVCRRAECAVVALAREEPIGGHVVPYLNRLSDLLFVMAREANRRAGREDVYWKKSARSTGSEAE